MKYYRCQKSIHEFRATNGSKGFVTTEEFEEAVKSTHETIDQIAAFKVNIFVILGMRNLSAFIGELFAANLISATKRRYVKNPHQDGYPDLLLMNEDGAMLYKQILASGNIRAKEPFSPFKNGGIEVKATCGSVPTPAQSRHSGMIEKPDLGDQRIGVLKGYDWKAHHRETNNLSGILWDFIEGAPRIVAVFFCPTLSELDWGKIVKPKEGGGRTTSVSIMTRDGVKKMYEHWVLIHSDDARYSNFLKKHNKDNSAGAIPTGTAAESY